MHCLGADCVSCVCHAEKFAAVWLALFCAFYGLWLPFSKVVLDLIDSRVQCEGDFLSLDVVSFVVYRAAAPSVYDHPECGSPPVLGGMAMLVSGACHGLH